MRGRVMKTIAGREVRFLMNLAAIRDVGEVNDVPREIGVALASGIGRTKEVDAILAAAAREGGAKITLEEIFEAIGLKGMHDLATELWLDAWSDDSGNSPAAVKPEATGNSASGNGSSQAA